LGVTDIRENVAQFLSLPLSEAARRKILYDNAARLFPTP
jgi:predicted TIM-barrel fold metal-dependent hydrolase